MSLDYNLTPIGRRLKGKWKRLLSRCGLMLRTDHWEAYVRPIEPKVNLYLLHGPTFRVRRSAIDPYLLEYHLKAFTCCFRLAEDAFWRGGEPDEYIRELIDRELAREIGRSVLKQAQPWPLPGPA